MCATIWYPQRRMPTISFYIRGRGQPCRATSAPCPPIASVDSSLCPTPLAHVDVTNTKKTVVVLRLIVEVHGIRRTQIINSKSSWFCIVAD